MDTFIILFAAFFSYHLAAKFFVKNDVRQVNIAYQGYTKKEPALLLKLAKIKKDHDTSYNDLTDLEKEKYDKIMKKIENAVWCTLTYLDSHSVIHVQQGKKSYLHKISNDDPYLVFEKIGNLDDSEFYYVLYRRNHGWLRGAELIGYFRTKNAFSVGKVLPLFRFPERLIGGSFLGKFLQSRYKLDHEHDGDYFTDELGYDRGYYINTYKTTGRGAKFNFDIY